LIFVDKEMAMKHVRGGRQYEWATVMFEGGVYDVCVGMEVEEIDEVRVVDSEVNITPVMRNDVIDWMLDRALADIAVGE
jgi:hypothetical protein